MKRLLLPIGVPLITGLIIGAIVAVLLYVKFHEKAHPAALTLPPRLNVNVKDIAMINVESSITVKEIKWWCAGDAVRLLPWPDGTQALFYATEPGVYHVVAYGADQKGVLLPHTSCRVVVGDAPSPTPNPPSPTDPLVIALQNAYGQEAASDKAQSLASLAELYAQGATAAIGRTDITTWGEFFGVLADVAKSVNVSGKIALIQGVVQAELSKGFPAVAATAFDAAARQLAANTLTRISTALKAVR